MEAAVKADRVLVPLDGSPFAEMALPRAIGLLHGNPSATLILLRAVEAKTLPGVDPTEAQTAVVGEADAYLKAVAARLENETMALVVRSMWYCSAAKAIVEPERHEPAQHARADPIRRRQAHPRKRSLVLRQRTIGQQRASHQHRPRRRAAGAPPQPLERWQQPLLLRGEIGAKGEGREQPAR